MIAKSAAVLVNLALLYYYPGEKLHGRAVPVRRRHGRRLRLHRRHDERGRRGQAARRVLRRRSSRYRDRRPFGDVVK